MSFFPPPPQSNKNLISLSLENNDASTFECLLNLGGDVDGKDEYQRTLAHIAASKGNVKLLNMLRLKSPSLLDSKDIDGKTPLHVAISCDHADAVRALIYFSDPMQKDKNGQSCVDVAMSIGNADIEQVVMSGVNKHVDSSWLSTTDENRVELAEIRSKLKLCEAGFRNEMKVEHLANQRMDVLKKVQAKSEELKELMTTCDALGIEIEPGHAKQVVDDMIAFAKKKVDDIQNEEVDRTEEKLDGNDDMILTQMDTQDFLQRFEKQRFGVAVLFLSVGMKTNKKKRKTGFSSDSMEVFSSLFAVSSHN